MPKLERIQDVLDGLPAGDVNNPPGAPRVKAAAAGPAPAPPGAPAVQIPPEMMIEVCRGALASVGLMLGAPPEQGDVQLVALSLQMIADKYGANFKYAPELFLLLSVSMAVAHMYTAGKIAKQAALEERKAANDAARS